MINFEASRTRLIEHLSSEIKDKRVLAAMSRIPRELFVPPENRQAAYDDKPLPIGYDQTISQPYIIAYMTEALELAGNEKVLELGTGSGYQTAILAELCRWVVTVERIPELADSARELLDKFGYNNIEVHLAEESLGWPQGAPYNAIMVTAGAPSVPDELLEQLAPGGRMVIPVGSRYMQELCKITKCQDKNQIRNLGGCRFVSLIGKNAWAK
jgi:protein-L-isoaspartate(D-aspartate) O-methyltransferase